MKPARIFEIMDLAQEARKNGDSWNPMFRGDAGVGKSEIVQQWVRKKRLEEPKFGFLDLRMAYLEAPDVIGFPKEVEFEGRWRTIHALPGFWPTDPNSSGVLLLEEVNRAPTSVTNALMQLLTDRKILSDDPNFSDYELPKGWIIASCVNPDTAKYDVQPMDQALIDRFEVFEIDYDHHCFVEYIEQAKWHKPIIQFLNSAIWVYKKPDAIGKDGKYISPRTWSKLNAAERAGAYKKRDLHRTICMAILGKHVGNEYWRMCHDDRPIMASDLINDYERSIDKLEKQSQPGKYAGDKIAMTIDSIIESYGGWYEGCGYEKDPEKIDESILVAVANIIPSDQAINLIRACSSKISAKDPLGFIKGFMVRHPEVVKILQSNVKIEQSIKSK